MTEREPPNVGIHVQAILERLGLSKCFARRNLADAKEQGSPRLLPPREALPTLLIHVRSEWPIAC